MKRTLGTLLLLVGLGACGPTEEPAGDHIALLAAASATDAITELRDTFQSMSGHRVELTFSGSSRLAIQLKNGLEADLFLPANRAWADQVTLDLRGRVSILDRLDLLSNHLVVIVPKTSSHELESVADLLEIEGEIAIAEPDSIPAGIYTKQALEKLDLWSHLQTRLVPGTNVRTALRYVETGAVVAGIVYASDAACSEMVRVEADIDSSLHDQIAYPLLLLHNSRSSVGARQLFEFLQSSEARTVFERYGFVSPPALQT